MMYFVKKTLHTWLNNAHSCLSHTIFPYIVSQLRVVIGPTFGILLTTQYSERLYLVGTCDLGKRGWATLAKAL